MEKKKLKLDYDQMISFVTLILWRVKVEVINERERNSSKNIMDAGNDNDDEHRDEEDKESRISKL